MSGWAGGQAWADDDSGGSESSSEAVTISTDYVTGPEGHGQEFSPAPMVDDAFNQQSWPPRQAGAAWAESSSAVPNYATTSGEDQELFYYGVEHRNPAAASHEFYTRQALPLVTTDSHIAPSAVRHHHLTDAQLTAVPNAPVGLDDTDHRSPRDPSAVAAGQMVTTATSKAVQAAMPSTIPAPTAAWPLSGSTDPSRFTQPRVKQEQHLRSHPAPLASQLATDKSEVANTCPFCIVLPNGKTRQRRVLKRERQRPKFGRWWRQAGYNGPKYCQRCSEVFRDHIMRQKPNSASCTRDHPCDDCTKVLHHFDKTGQALWDSFDERAASNKAKVVAKRKQHQVEGGAAQLPLFQRPKLNPVVMTPPDFG